MKQAERTDEELVTALCDGDHEAMAEIVRRYETDIFRFCMHYLRHVDRATEIAQETFVRIYVARGRFDTGRAFRPWILCIARNLCLNELKRKKPVQMDSLEEYASEMRAAAGGVAPGATDSPDVQAMTAERRKVLMDVLDTLDDSSRELLFMRFFEKMAAREIGEVIGASEGAVRTRVHRLLKMLRERFGDLGNEV